MRLASREFGDRTMTLTVHSKWQKIMQVFSTAAIPLPKITANQTPDLIDHCPDPDLL